MGIDGNQERAETRGRQALDFLWQKPAVGDDARLHPGGARVGHHAVYFGMHQGLAALKRDITHAPAMEDRQRAGKFRPIQPALLLDQLLVVGVRAEIARRVAGIRYRYITHSRHEPGSGGSFPCAHVVPWYENVLLRKSVRKHRHLLNFTQTRRCGMKRASGHGQLPAIVSHHATSAPTPDPEHIPTLNLAPPGNVESGRFGYEETAHSPRRHGPARRRLLRIGLGDIPLGRKRQWWRLKFRLRIRSELLRRRLKPGICRSSEAFCPSAKFLRSKLKIPSPPKSSRSPDTPVHCGIFVHFRRLHLFIGDLLLLSKLLE